MPSSNTCEQVDEAAAEPLRHGNVQRLGERPGEVAAPPPAPPPSSMRSMLRCCSRICSMTSRWRLRRLGCVERDHRGRTGAALDDGDLAEPRPGPRTRMVAESPCGVAARMATWPLSMRCNVSPGSPSRQIGFVAPVLPAPRCGEHRPGVGLGKPVEQCELAHACAVCRVAVCRVAVCRVAVRRSRIEARACGQTNRRGTARPGGTDCWSCRSHISIMWCSGSPTWSARSRSTRGSASRRFGSRSGAAARLRSCRCASTTTPSSISRLGEVTGINIDHFALVVEGVDLAELAASGRFGDVHPPLDLFGARGVGQGIYVKDPDGHTVELRTYPA